MSGSYTRIPVKVLDWEESHRRNSQAINWLIDRVPTQAISYGLSNPSYTATAGSPSTPINGYTGSLSSQFAIAADGTITVLEAGLYKVTGLVIFTGGLNQDSYTLEVIRTVSGTPTYSNLAVTEWASKTVAASLSGAKSIALDVNDVVAIGIYEAVTSRTLNLTSGQILIEQVT